jgi:hypothetical protein
VPRSIVLNELLRPIERDPRYLQRHDMEIVRGGSDDALVVPPNAANVALLRQGMLRLRQRPSPRNSLGLVKFVFPNGSKTSSRGATASAPIGASAAPQARKTRRETRCMRRLYGPRPARASQIPSVLDGSGTR